MDRGEREVEDGEMVVGSISVGSLNNINYLLQDMDCKGNSKSKFTYLGQLNCKKG